MPGHARINHDRGELLANRLWQQLRTANYSLLLALCACSLVLRVLYPFPTDDVDSGWLLPLGLQFMIIVPVAIDLAIAGFVWSWKYLIPIAFLAMIWISAFAADYRLPALTGAWEITAAFLLFLAITRLPNFSRKLLGSLLLALAIGQSVLACWQIGVSLPELRARYERGDLEIRKSLIQMGIEDGAAEGRMRDRLNSREAFGSYGHPNTLAGFFLICLPLSFALFAGARMGKSRFGMALAGAVIFALLFGLLLTRSRSAWGAAVVAMAVYAIALSSIAEVLTKHIGKIIGGLVVCAILIVALVQLGVFDRLIVDEAGKSLSYRWEWWRSTVELIRESPILGVGFGNFQSHYTKYKLPFSSEEIDDPHNFVLQLAACAGCMTALIYLVLIVHLSIRSLRMCRRDPEADSLQPESEVANSTTFVGHRSVWMGAVAAIFLLAFVGLELEALATLVVGIIIAGLTSHWMESLTGRRWHAVLLASLIAIHVHWLVAGGVVVPGLMVALWPIAGLCAPASQIRPENRAIDLTGMGLALAILAVFALFVGTYWLPLSAREQRLAHLRISNGANVPAEKAINAIRWSLDEYPGDAKVWLKLFATYAQLMRGSQGPAAKTAYQEAERAIQQSLKLEPRRAFLYAELARLHADAATSNLDPAGDKLARVAYNKMIENYPNLAVNRWLYARHLLKMEEKQDAIEQFKLSLWLDETPHPDKKLTADQRQFAKDVLTKSVE